MALSVGAAFVSRGSGLKLEDAKLVQKRIDAMDNAHLELVEKMENMEIMVEDNKEELGLELYLYIVLLDLEKPVTLLIKL